MSRKLMYSVPLLAVALIVAAAQLFGGGQVHAQSPYQPHPVVSLFAVATDGTYLGQEGYKPSDNAITVWWIPPQTGPKPVSYVIEATSALVYSGSRRVIVPAAESTGKFTFIGLPNPIRSGTPYTVEIYLRGEHYIKSASKTVEVTLPPKFVTPQTDEPEPDPVIVPTGPVQNLSLNATASTLTASWDAPATGTGPIRYRVVVRNTETDKAMFKRNVSDMSVTFDNKLKSGKTYSVSVRAKNRTLYGWKTIGHYLKDGEKKPPINHEVWVGSDWVKGEVTLKGEADAAGDSARLVWIYLHAGEKTPGYAVGEPTQYVRQNYDGTTVKYDPVAECVASAVADFNDAMAKYQKSLAALEAELADAQAELATATNEGERYLAQLKVNKAQSAVDARKDSIAAKEADARTECAALHPEDENLTEADARWVQVPADMVEDK